ncbi:MAG: DNA internalization-related competence protein ComEC/Rec2 [Eubacterium sp.]
MRRKLSIICFLFIAGIVTAYIHLIFCLLCGGILTAALCFSEDRQNLFSCALKRAVWVSFILGAALFLLQSAAVREGKTLNGEKRVWMGKVSSVSRTVSGSSRLLCCLQGPFPESGPGKGLRGNPYSSQRTYLYTREELPSGAELVGKMIRFSAVLEEPEGRRNPNTFDYRLYLLSRGISHTAFTDKILVTDAPLSPAGRIRAGILRIRERFLDSLNMPDEEKQLLAGVLFGCTEEMPEEMKEDFRSNGTAHILAVSGLHVGVIYGLYRRLTAGRKKKYDQALLIVFLLFYGCITLWTVSVVRAILLILFMTFGGLLSRRYDLLTSLGFTAALIAVHNPYAVLGASFQLSFLAVTSISFISPVIARKLPAWLPAEIPASLAVQIGTVPYCACMFNQIALAALICNIPVLLLLGILAPAGILAIPAVLLLSVFPESCSCSILLRGISGILRLLSGGMLELNRLLSQDGRFAVDVVSISPVLLAAGGLLVFFVCSEFFQVFWMRGERKYLLKMAAFLLIPCIAAAGFCRDDFRKASVVLVDVGQGDCVHIKGKKNILLDGGGSPKRNIGKQVLKPYLLKNGCRELDAAMATHLHMDHFLGLQQLQELYPVRSLITKGHAGQHYLIGGNDYIEILWPLRQDPEEEDENLNSLVFKVHTGGLTVLVTGDVGETGEQGMLDLYRGTDALHCDVLKVGHHGSRYSSTEEFIDAVSPSIAVIGVGKKNTYGHPCREVLKRFERRRIPVYRTDLDGAVGIYRDRRDRLRVCTVVPRENT